MFPSEPQSRRVLSSIVTLFEWNNSDLIDYDENYSARLLGARFTSAIQTRVGAAVKGGDEFSRYGDDPELTNLTWDNLGYRLGRLFGPTSDELKQELFEWCVAQQKEDTE